MYNVNSLVNVGYLMSRSLICITVKVHHMRKLFCFSVDDPAGASSQQREECRLIYIHIWNSCSWL